jgi:hypothetical protein
MTLVSYSRRLPSFFRCSRGGTLSDVSNSIRFANWLVFFYFEFVNRAKEQQTNNTNKGEYK